MRIACSLTTGFGRVSSEGVVVILPSGRTEGQGAGGHRGLPGDGRDIPGSSDAGGGVGGAAGGSSGRGGAGSFLEAMSVNLSLNCLNCVETC